MGKSQREGEILLGGRGLRLVVGGTPTTVCGFRGDGGGDDVIALRCWWGWRVTVMGVGSVADDLDFYAVVGRCVFVDGERGAVAFGGDATRGDAFTDQVGFDDLGLLAR
jgi:hypothetical protein